MLTNEQVAQFNVDGFLNGGKILDDAQVDILRDELSRVIAGDSDLDRQPVLSMTY